MRIPTIVIFLLLMVSCITGCNFKAKTPRGLDRHRMTCTRYKASVIADAEKHQELLAKVRKREKERKEALEILRVRTKHCRNVVQMGPYDV